MSAWTPEACTHRRHWKLLQLKSPTATVIVDSPEAADAVVLWPRKSCYCVAPRTWDTAPANLGHALHPRAAAAAGGLTSWVHTQVHSVGSCFSGLSSESCSAHTHTLVSALWLLHIHLRHQNQLHCGIVRVSWAPELLSPHAKLLQCVPLWQLGVCCVSSVSAAID